MASGQIELTRRAMRPIVIGLFTLTENGLEVDGRPTFGQYAGVGDFIHRAQKASGWWLADWIVYGEGREDWKKQVEALIDFEVLTEASVKQYRYVAKAVPKSRRLKGVPFGHHTVVASLPPDQQREWLRRSKTEGWTQQELRKNLRAHQRTKIIEGQAVLKGMFRILYADPPWLYSDSGPTVDGSLGKAERHFPGMTIKELCDLPVEAHAMENSVLFCWVTAPMLYEDPGPREVIQAWGFKPKTGLIWDKVLHNWGHYVGIHHEHLIIATRGSCMPDVPTPLPDSVQVIRRSGEHSEKPEFFRKEIIERLYTTGPRLELFGRRPVEGWSVFGNDARLWQKEMAATA